MSAAMDELAARRRRARPDDEGTIPEQRTVLAHIWRLRGLILGWAVATVALAVVAIALAVSR